jgi:hypothetical protein
MFARVACHGMFSYAMHPSPASFLHSYVVYTTHHHPSSSHKLLWWFLNVEKVVKIASVLSRIFEHPKLCDLVKLLNGIKLLQAVESTTSARDA